MRIVSHNKVSDINTDDVKFQGVIDANYNDLVKVFGEPLEGDKYMTDAQWKLKLVIDKDTTHSLLLYNFKNGKNYLGDDGLAVERIPNWNVSSSEPEVNASGYIQKYLKRRLNK